MDFNKRYMVYDGNIDYRVVGNKAIILNVNNAYFYTVEDAGAVIWEELIKQKTLEEIVEVIKNKYEVEGDALRNDVAELITGMEEERLIRPL